MGGAGDDTLSGGDGPDQRCGQSGDDILYGGEGDDWLGGDNGDDEMYGEAGNDVSDGRSGVDLHDMGAGDDTMCDSVRLGGTDGTCSSYQTEAYGGDDIDKIYIEPGTQSGVGGCMLGSGLPDLGLEDTEEGRGEVDPFLMGGGFTILGSGSTLDEKAPEYSVCYVVAEFCESN